MGLNPFPLGGKKRLHLSFYFFKPLPNTLGVDKNVEVDLNEGATVMELIEKMAERYGEKFKRIIIEINNKKAIMLLDGKYADFETMLTDGDKLVFMLPYVGG